MLFEGKLKLYNTQDISVQGRMPEEMLVPLPGGDEFFTDRTIGFTRNYAALGADQRIDRLVRIWRRTDIRTGHYAVIDDEQYRIDFIQHLLDEDDLQVTDLTLRRLEKNYDIYTEYPQ